MKAKEVYPANINAIQIDQSDRGEFRYASSKLHNRCSVSGPARDMIGPPNLMLTTSTEGYSSKVSMVKVFRPVRPTTRSSVEPLGFRLSRKFDIPSFRRGRVTEVATLYKRKDQKVLPVNQARITGEGPGGEARWKKGVMEKEEMLLQGRPPSKWDKWLIPRIATTPEGTRLTPDRRATLHIGSELQPAEVDVLMRVLLNREMALSWEFREIGCIKPEVAPPQEIDTVPHEPWCAPNFPIPKALHKTVCDMLRERLDRGILEYCNGPYRNPWFLVKKHDGKYRMINAAMNINRVTRKDANLPPSPDEFAEDFAGMQIGSFIDFFSGYDQLTLAPVSRDMTAIHTPLGLLRQTTVLQGATNSVSQFVRVVTKILEEHIPNRARPFVDDIGVKGPKERYNNDEVPGLPGIRRFVMEHLQNLDQVLADLERAGATISAIKSKFGVSGMKVVGYVCDSDGRHPEAMKVAKIIEWRHCRSVTEARAFIGVCVYYRIWIPEFASIARPIFRLFQSGTPFDWGMPQILAMEKLKEALTTAPALMPISYEADAGEIIMAVDASLDGWGGILMQLDKEKKRHPSRYESGLWNEAERKYDAGKRECRGLLKMLKKVRHYLYGVRFVIETDAKTLVAQLNRSASDVPGALVTRWLAWIALFDFDVRHVSGKKHTAADGLSRRPATILEEEQPLEDDIDEFIAAELWSVQVVSPSTDLRPSLMSTGVYPFGFGDIQEEGEIALADEAVGVGERTQGKQLEAGYSVSSQQYADFLTTLKRPDEMDSKEFRQFKAEAMKYIVQDSHLFRRASKNVPLRRVVDATADRQLILKSLHEESGHRGQEGTYRRVADRYWWKDLYKDAVKHVQTCEECQKRDPGRKEEALHPTWVSSMWKKAAIDLVHLPKCQGYSYLAVLREDLSGWVEAKPLRNKEAKTVATFLWEVICRFGIFGQLTVDGGGEFQDVVSLLTRKYGIHRVQVSAYHPQANGMVERGHKPIVDALAKLEASGKGHWVENLNLVLFADRASVKVTTGVSPMRMNYGYEPLLPIETQVSSRNYLEWSKARTTAELLELRALQFDRRDTDLAEAQDRLRRRREEGKEYFDDTHRIRVEELKEGDLVLLHNSQRQKDMSRLNKLSFKWLGPYRIRQANPLRGSFALAEVDGAELGGTVAGNRLKKFYPRSGEFSVTRQMDPDGDRQDQQNEDEELDVTEMPPTQRDRSRRAAAAVESEDDASVLPSLRGNIQRQRSVSLNTQGTSIVEVEGEELRQWLHRARPRIEVRV